MQFGNQYFVWIYFYFNLKGPIQVLNPFFLTKLVGRCVADFGIFTFSNFKENLYLYKQTVNSIKSYLCKFEMLPEKDE
jgi:hypothetical protein